MKKKIIISMLALILVFGSSAFAQTDTSAGTQDTTTTSAGTSSDQVPAEGDGEDEDGDEDEDADHDADEAEDADDADEDEDDGAGKASKEDKGKQKSENAKKGLERALQNVKGTPAEEVIQGLLDSGASAEELAEQLDELADLLEEAADEEVSEDEGEEAGDEAAEDAESTEDEGEEKAKKNKELIELAKDILKDIKDSEKDSQVKGKAFKDLAEFFADNEEWLDAIESQEGLLELDGDELAAYQFLGELYQAAGVEGVTAFVNGKKPAFDVPPMIKDGRTLVPFRAIAEALDAEVAWDGETRTVTIVRDGVTVQLPVGSSVAVINGQEVTLDVPASIVNGRTVVPARFIAEALGALVEWVPEGQIVVVTDTTGTSGSTESSTTDSSATTAN